LVVAICLVRIVPALAVVMVTFSLAGSPVIATLIVVPTGALLGVHLVAAAADTCIGSASSPSRSSAPTNVMRRDRRTPSLASSTVECFVLPFVFTFYLVAAHRGGRDSVRIPPDLQAWRRGDADIGVLC